VDLASVAAVEALGCEPGMSVLDLCCAPGAKLGLLADRLRRSGCLVGADNSASRLDVCAGLARRLRWAAPRPCVRASWRFALLLADGASGRPLEAAAVRWNTAMDGVAFRDCAGTAESRDADPLELVTPARPRAGCARARARLARDTHLPTKFHRVLVDAQCTTDASFRHVLRHYGDEQVWTEPAIEALFEQWMDEREELQAVQRGLIHRGFSALAPGGRMLYATCSFAPAQNEEIVQWLLTHEPAARLLPLPPPCAVKRRRDSQRMPLAAYMDPITSATSGLFMALVEKA
jgi:16S rRNA C967 or C1407 C5-methylase (RsmB/RsmF family)